MKNTVDAESPSSFTYDFFCDGETGGTDYDR
jgi:hypothetical protein